MSLEPIDEVFELAQDGRLDEALHVLDGEIHEQPREAELRALRALVLLDLDRRDEAAEAARLARELDPELGFAEYASGLVAMARGDIGEAIGRAVRARQLDPTHAEFVVLEARGRLAAGQWDEVEQLTSLVLSHVPDHEGAALLRTLARESRRGNRPLAREEWEALATQFPMNPLARSGRAWTLLHAGQARDARAEFEQALALDPNSEWAREGLVLSLKARAPGYRFLLRWFMWLGGLSPRARMGLAIGGILGYRVLDSLGEQQPALKPFLIPVMVAYLALVLASWLADPLLNGLLLLTADGRRLLSRDDKQSGVVICAVLALALALVVGGLVRGSDTLLLGALAVGMTSITAAGAYQCNPGTQRRLLLGLAALLVLTALVATALAWEGLTVLVILGVAISSWLTGPLARRSRGVPS